MITFPLTLFSAADEYRNTKSTDFNGSTQYGNAGNDASFSITNNLSVFAWVKTTSTNVSSVVSKFTLAGSNAVWFLGLNSSGGMTAAVSADGGITNYKSYISNDTRANNGEWHHIGFTFSSNVLRLYMDGTEQSVSTPVNGTVNTLATKTPVEVIIGAYDGGSTSNFNGNIDEPTIWENTILSAQDVVELYDLGTPRDPAIHTKSADLMAHWYMGDNDSFPTSTDRTGTNDITLTNMLISNIQADVPFYNPGLSMEFTGANQGIKPQTLAFSGIGNSISGAIWVKPDLYSNTPHLFASGNASSNNKSFFLKIETSGKVSFVTCQNGFTLHTITSPLAVSTTAWTHIAFSFDGSLGSNQMKLYIDGVLAQTGSSFFGNLYNSFEPFAIAYIPNSIFQNNVLDGKLKDALIYNGVLSGTDVSDIYGDGVTLVDPRTLDTAAIGIFYYPMGHGMYKGTNMNDYFGSYNGPMIGRSDLNSADDAPPT